jgi:DMSO/TMAO reductase YedYZ molybdopterin-dependent catalytic subunit
MSTNLSRRRLLTTSLITGAVGVTGLAAAERIADRFGIIPPDSGGIWGLGETLTYSTQRLLMSWHSMAREFSPSQISKVIPVSGVPPKTDDYQRLLANNCKDYRLTVDGLLARPASFSLDEIKRMPTSSQITHQACEEGWSFIAQWHGVPLSYVFNQVGVTERARWAVIYAADGAWDSIDLPDAYHGQTILAYGLNGSDLTPEHGAPLRLRVARQLGYKSVKFITRISLVDDLKKVRNGKGSIAPDFGYSWYAGI